jgi:hypothetical protein
MRNKIIRKNESLINQNNIRYLTVVEASKEFGMPTFLLDEALQKNDLPFKFKAGERAYKYDDLNRITTGLDW